MSQILSLLFLILNSFNSFATENVKLKWMAPEYPGLSFMYPACLEATDILDQRGLVYSFANSEKCSKVDLDKWRIQIGFFSNGLEETGSKFPETVNSKLKINGISIIVSELKDLSVPYSWFAKFTCNKKIVNLVFYRDMKAPVHDWKHQQPPMFKEFLETVRCEKI